MMMRTGTTGGPYPPTYQTPPFNSIVSYAMLNTTVWRLAVTPMNGDADLWCWIPKSHRWARFGAVYIYIYPSMLFISYVFIQVKF